MRPKIERFNDKTKTPANKHHKDVQFKPGDLLWIHITKERFLSKRRSKLLPCSDGPFRVLEKVNCNAYKVNLLREYRVFATINVANLRPYLMRKMSYQV